MMLDTTTTTRRTRPVSRNVVVGSRHAGAATGPAAATAATKGRLPTTRVSAVRGPSVNFFNFFGSKKDDVEPEGVSYDLLDLNSGAEGSVQAAADVFERVDDVVMGGVSSSVIGPDLAGRDCLVWAGKCRVEGGGFTGKGGGGGAAGAAEERIYFFNNHPHASVFSLLFSTTKQIPNFPVPYPQVTTTAALSLSLSLSLQLAHLCFVVFLISYRNQSRLSFSIHSLRPCAPGTRTVALKTPLDLSAFDGIAMRCGFESDEEPQRRTWKATVRTENNRGELVYQATFVPPVSDATAAAGEEGGDDDDERQKTKKKKKLPAEIRIPWESFRLVRGPVAVPDVPPLSADQCKEVYGLGLIMSRFGPQGPMPEFREGTFRLALHAFGVYSADTAAASAEKSSPPPPPQTLVAAVADNAGKKSSENRGSRNALTFVLAPLIALVFSESGRRRKRARGILKERYGMSEFKARFGFGQALKAARKSSGVAVAVEGLAELVRDVAATVLILPLRGLFILVSKLGRLVRRLKGEKPLPKMR